MSLAPPSAADRAARDQRTVDAFYREAPRLRAWLRRHAAAWQGIDDLLQDLFLELVLANRAARRIENIGAWLFQVARYRITDALRQRQPLNRALALDATPEALTAGRASDPHSTAIADPETDYRQADFARRLEAALEGLPPEQRRVFVAHEIEGLSMAEIAGREGIGLNTALARKRYAVLRLRQSLADFDERYIPN
jgi:RNA polymerase sigma factor (sigma-70 family)